MISPEPDLKVKKYGITELLSKVPVITILLLPADVSRMAFAASVTGLEREIPCRAVIVSDKIKDDERPDAICVKAPSTFVGLVDTVNKPVLVTWKGPLFVVVAEPAWLKFVPTKMIPADVLVFIFPINEVVPLPACCEIEAAVIVFRVAFRTDVIKRSPIGVTPPRTPAKRSRPAVNVKSKFPLTVVTVISPREVPEFNTTFDVKVIGLANERGVFWVVTLLPKLTLPIPV